MTSRLSIAIAGVAAAVALAGSAPAATNDRPSTGKFVGTHFFEGPVKLVFKRTDGIGLYVAKYVVRGTYRCEDEEIPIDYSGTVTAKSSAKVKKDRTFKLSIAGMRLNGQFTSSKRVKGNIELILSSSTCAPEGGFTAKKQT